MCNNNYDHACTDNHYNYNASTDSNPDIGSNAKPHAFPNTCAHDFSNTFANSFPNTLPNTRSHAFANTFAYTFAYTLSDAISDTIPNSVPYAVPNSVPNSVPHSIPDSLSHTISNPFPDAFSDVTSIQRRLVPWTRWTDLQSSMRRQGENMCGRQLARFTERDGTRRPVSLCEWCPTQQLAWMQLGEIPWVGPPPRLPTWPMYLPWCSTGDLRRFKRWPPGTSLPLLWWRGWRKRSELAVHDGWRKLQCKM